MNEEELRRLELEAEAEAEAEYQFLQQQKTKVGPPGQPDQMSLFSAAKVGSLPDATSVPNLDALQPNFQNAFVTGTRAAGAMAGAGLLAPAPYLGATAGEEVAHQLNKLIGAEPESSLGSDATNFALRYGVNRTLGSLPDIYKYGREKIFGPPKDVVLQRAADQPTIYGNVLGAEQTKGAGETAYTQNLGEFKDSFTRRNPVGGIDTKNLSAADAMGQFSKNLENIKTEAITGRNSILQNAAKGELAFVEQAAASGVPVKLGISFDDIPTAITNPDGTVSSLDLIARTGGDGGEAGVIAATKFIKSKFGMDEAGSLLDASGKVIPPSSGKLTVAELHEAIQSLDGQIRALGGYDLSVATPGINPSAIISEASALKFYRGQLSKLLNDRIARFTSPDDAIRFSQLGEDYGMALQTETLRERMQTQSMQPFSPAGEKSAPNRVTMPGLLGRAQSILPNAPARAQQQALDSQVAALENLQRLVELNRAPAPIPRNIAEIKTNMTHLSAVESVAIRLGVISAAGELLKMPDAQAQQVVGAIASIAPEAFVPNPDKVNVIDDEFVNPLDSDLIKKKYRDSDPETRAMHIGASFQNKYIPPKPQRVELQPRIQALPVTLEKLNRGLAQAFQTPAPMPERASPDMVSQLEQLTKMKALHEFDVQ